MHEYTIDEATEISKVTTTGAIKLISAAVTLLIGVILVKLLWAWTVPELLPAAVEAGLIVGDITWLTTLKITALVAVLTSTGSLIFGQWRR